MPADISAKQFVKKLEALRSAEELKKIQRYFKSGEGQYGEGDKFIGVRMGHVFALAKEFMEMSPNEIEKLLESPIHEVRVGAVSIMDWQARSKGISDERRKELFDLYIKRHDRINNWDLVDRSTPYVVGGYCSISRARFCTSWRPRKACGNAAPRLSALSILSEKAKLRTRSKSPRCC